MPIWTFFTGDVNIGLLLGHYLYTQQMGQMMDHLLVRIYALLVCFVTVICITVSTGMGLYEIVKIISPELTMSTYRYQHLQSIDVYGQNRYPGFRITGPESGALGQLPVPKSAEELNAIREAELQALMDNERKAAIASLIRIAIVLIVTIPLFYLHWQISKGRKPDIQPAV